MDIHRRSNGDALRKEEDLPIDFVSFITPRQVVISRTPIPEDQNISAFINILKPRR